MKKLIILVFAVSVIVGCNLPTEINKNIEVLTEEVRNTHRTVKAMNDTIGNNQQLLNKIYWNLRLPESLKRITELNGFEDFTLQKAYYRFSGHTYIWYAKVNISSAIGKYTITGESFDIPQEAIDNMFKKLEEARKELCK